MVKRFSGKRSNKGSKKRPGIKAETLEVTVNSLGGQGDGIARTEDGRIVYVPFTLPGERVRVTLTAKRGDGYAARLDEVLEPSDDRVEPFCEHFGICGGCSLQHMTDEAALAFKRARVEDTLRRRGFEDVWVDPCVATPRDGRRRVTLSVEGRGKKVLLGFQKRFGHDIVDIESCPVLRPELNAMIPYVRQVMPYVLEPNIRAKVQATLCETGVDVIIQANTKLGYEERQTLAEFAEAADLSRLSWQNDDELPEPMAQRRISQVKCGKAMINLPAGAFLQASHEGETILCEHVQDALSNCKRIADLYAGLGTFAFALSDTALVHAVEVLDDATRALQTAAGRANLGGRVTAEARDLDSNPLTPKDLDGFDGVVFDPPRAGAQSQAEQLAESYVETVVAVSCNPATFARDARILIEGDYEMGTILPVDQFPYTGHVELVAVFRRD